jgi:WD40 repeat protein
VVAGSLCLWLATRKKAVATARLAHGRATPACTAATDAWRPDGGGCNWISALGVVPFSDLAASGSADGTVRFWRCDAQESALEQVYQAAVPGQARTSGKARVRRVGARRDGRNRPPAPRDDSSRWHRRSCARAHRRDALSLAVSCALSLVCPLSVRGALSLSLSSALHCVSARFNAPFHSVGFVNAIEIAQTSRRFAVAAVGQEHRLGRWFTDKSAHNGIAIVQLPAGLSSA